MEVKTIMKNLQLTNVELRSLSEIMQELLKTYPKEVLAGEIDYVDSHVHEMSRCKGCSGTCEGSCRGNCDGACIIQ